MAETTKVVEPLEGKTANIAWSQATAYERWMESIGIPVHRGYYIEDARTVELGRWPERECNAAFLELEGQKGVSESRITEIAPGTSLPPLKFALDEIVYVLEGRGLTTLSWDGTDAKKTFEWQKHSLFLLPRNCTHQLANTQGNASTRLLHTNYLPIAMSTVGEPDPFFNPAANGARADGQADLFSEAKAITPKEGGPRGGTFWYGAFFPNLRAWDNLVPFKGRGAGGHVVWIRFPDSPITCHMSVFPAQTYKKAHRHGPGFVIVIPAGDGYSVMWPEGRDRIVVPWHEGSVFVPPFRWFHQHFNLGTTPARYLALHPPRGLPGYTEVLDDLSRDQLDYPEQDPWIRSHFEEELAKRGLKTSMPEQAYRDSSYEWAYGE